MIIHGLFFYIFATVMIFSAVMVIGARNSVHSVLFLILAFVNGAGLFLLIGAEFLALLLIVVYVGAVMVLFLFVVMMLDIDFVTLKQGFLSYLPVGALIAIVLLIEIIVVVTSQVFTPVTAETAFLAASSGESNISAIGKVLYTDHMLFFQLAGIILLVAMIGAIVLTLRHKPDVKRQDITKQVNRDPDKALQLHDIKPGSGVQDG